MSLVLSALLACEPEWIWSGPDREGASTAAFTAGFPVTGPVESAELRAAADFASLTIRINGKTVVENDAFDPHVRRDVTPLIVPGRNRIEIEARGVEGPSAVAAGIRLLYPDGTAQEVTSAKDWIRKGASYGDASGEPWWRLAPVAINALDDYTQWKRATGAAAGTDPATFELLPGHEVALLRSAGAEEGSWVSIAFDPEGRLTIGREDKGLLRATFGGPDGAVSRIETIEDSLLECRGLLYAHGSLYVNANNSLELVRLRDTDGDGRFDERKTLHRSEGGKGHGRNDLALGRDGKIYAIHGDSVRMDLDLPDRTSPLRRNHTPFRPNEGHVLRMDPDGSNLEIFCAGLRNPYGIAFNEDGEPFTYDADAEHDMGSPWYRPTRVIHLVSGGDTGWRAVTGSWPPYAPDHPDNAQPVLDIGKGSPTGVKFGTRSRFPPEYRRALYVLDWAYGRILAVHLQPHGASYRGTPEVFLRGRPLNVTDLAFGPDGAMYFVTGGRKTRSALYRVRYAGPAVETPPDTAQAKARRLASRSARARRREVEAFHAPGLPVLGSTITPYLQDADPRIRYAARIALENHFASPLLNEIPGKQGVEVATIRLLGFPTDQLEKELDRLPPIDPALSPGNALAWAHLYPLCLSRAPELLEKRRTLLLKRLGNSFPHRSDPVNRTLAPLVIALEPERFVPIVMTLMDQAPDTRARIHYLFHLRHATRGWNAELRTRYFTELEAASRYPGGRGLPKMLSSIRKDVLSHLKGDHRKRFEAILKPDRSALPAPDPTRKLVKKWALSDFDGKLDAGGDPKRGRDIYSKALCIRCHRLGTSGIPVGPDLTGAASRFSRRDILQAILDPSQTVAMNYRSDMIRLKDGRTLTGQIVPQLDYRSPELLIATDVFNLENTVRVRKADVLQHRKSTSSLMPSGLLDTFTAVEILDLLSWIETGGSRDR